MRCPYCSHPNNRVLDSRLTDEERSIRRRRECAHCEKRFTTYERFEETVLMVVKKDGRREKFDRQKIVHGVMRACEKRPVTGEQVEELTSSVESALRQKNRNEIPVAEIGERILEQLRSLDEVAYVRYASVYKDFNDVSRFIEELQTLPSYKTDSSED